MDTVGNLWTLECRTCQAIQELKVIIEDYEHHRNWVYHELVQMHRRLRQQLAPAEIADINVAHMRTHLMYIVARPQMLEDQPQLAGRWLI